MALAVLVASAALYLWPLRPYGLMLLDEGYVVHAAQRMLGGELLYRDVFAHYAPLRYHVLEAAFAAARPSFLVARTVELAVLLANVAIAFRLARRLVPVAPAMLPAAVLAALPGPWTKAWFGFSIGICLLALTRALERPLPRRWGTLGVAVGVALATRQDVGLVQLALALAAAPLPALFPQRFGGSRPPSAARALHAVACTAGGAALVLGGVALWYAAHGGLAALVDATLLRAFTQRDAYGFGLPRLLARGGVSDEGRLAGAVMLAPLALLVLGVPVWVARLRRCGLDARTVWLAALLATGAAAASNAYYQLRVLRFLQSALPYYLIATWLLAEAAAAGRRRGGALGAGAGLATAGVGLAAAGALAWAVLAGIAHILPGDEYTGSWRMRSLAAPLEALGDPLLVDWETAEEIRLLRGLVDERVPSGEPIFVAPYNLAYYPLLARPNPLWMGISDFVPGDFLLSDAEKRAQMAQLLASPAQLALAEGAWLGQPGAADAVRRTLLEHFRPVRRARSTLVLARGADPDTLRMLEIKARTGTGPAAPGDLEAMQAIVARHAGDPLPHEILAMVWVRLGRLDEAVGELESAARLDPDNPEMLEQAAELLVAAGRPGEALGLLTRAEAVRESPTTRALRARLARQRAAPARPDARAAAPP